MAIIDAQKIFIDVDDEINFVVEQINASDKQRVIVVVPQNALLISSQVSSRILAKQVVKSKKLVIVVTEDAFGLQLLGEAGLVATNKVSNVTPELWEASQIKKDQLQAAQEATKQELLARRGIESGQATGSQVQGTRHKVDIDEVGDQEEQVVQGLDSEGAPDTDHRIPTTDSVADTDIKGPIQRPRPQAKLVQVGAFQVFAGGDVGSVVESTHEIETNVMETKHLDQSDNEPPAKPRGGFTGRDWTKYTGDSAGGGSILARLFPRKSTGLKNPREEDTPKESNRKRNILIAAGVVVVLLVFGIYLLLFRINQVTAKITLVTTEVPVEQQITIDTAQEEVDTENLVLPAKPLTTAEEISVSGSADTTGEGLKGDKAAGLIEIWNKTQEEVQLAQGTVLTEIGSGRKYILQEDTTLPPATLDPDDPNLFDSFGGAGDELRIEAAEVGEEYNITDDETGLEFKVGDFSTDELIGKRFRKIEGGTSEKFKAVSKEDVEKLLEQLEQELRQKALEEIANSVADGSRIISGTEEITITKSEANPKRGEEGDSFSITLSGTITALAVNEEDLSQAIEVLIAQSGEIEGEFKVTGLEDAVVADVSREGGRATFLITSQGSLQSSVTEDEIKQELMGKTIQGARDYLNSVEDIENFSLSYSPGFIPENLQYVPNDAARIHVEL